MPFQPESLSPATLADLVKACRKAAPSILGHDLPQHQAQELIARTFKFSDWQEASKRVGTARPEKELPVLSATITVAQLSTWAQMGDLESFKAGLDLWRTQQSRGATPLASVNRNSPGGDPLGEVAMIAVQAGQVQAVALIGHQEVIAQCQPNWIEQAVITENEALFHAAVALRPAYLVQEAPHLLGHACYQGHPAFVPIMWQACLSSLPADRLRETTMRCQVSIMEVILDVGRRHANYLTWLEPLVGPVNQMADEILDEAAKQDAFWTLAHLLNAQPERWQAQPERVARVRRTIGRSVVSFKESWKVAKAALQRAMVPSDARVQKKARCTA